MRFKLAIVILLISIATCLTVAKEFPNSNKHLKKNPEQKDVNSNTNNYGFFESTWEQFKETWLTVLGIPLAGLFAALLTRWFVQRKIKKMEWDHIRRLRAVAAAGFITFIEDPKSVNKENYYWQVVGRYYKLASWLDENVLEAVNKYVIDRDEESRKDVILELHESLTDKKRKRKDINVLELAVLENLINAEIENNNLDSK